MKKELTLQTQRKSNFELLRIISMLMIVAHHLAIHSGLYFPQIPITMNRIFALLVLMGGKIGVNIFVLISGYFLINSNFKIKKLLKLWLQVMFYSISIYVLFIVILKRSPYENQLLIKTAYPITHSLWWFARTYFALYICSPFINKFLRALSKDKHKKVIVILTIMFCFIPSLMKNSYFYIPNLAWFIYLYALSAYIKLYGIKIEKEKTRTLLLFTIFFIIINLELVFLIEHLTRLNIIRSIPNTFFYDMNKLPILIISLFIFLVFKKLNINQSKIINTISSATFGIYLIHDHPIIRQFIWRDTFKVALISEDKYFIPYCLGTILIVFIVCCVIELIRKTTIERFTNFIIEKVDIYFKNKKLKS